MTFITKIINFEWRYHKCKMNIKIVLSCQFLVETKYIILRGNKEPKY